jgi:ADP-ribose pyrophosphatase YjhB (NUDIX family)
LRQAIRRELKEELGIEVGIVCRIGVVSDYYNLIHRHNINNYYLCKVSSFGEKNLTKDEIENFHLSTLKISFEEAVKEYEKCSNTKLGRLVANRELPILKQAKHIIDMLEISSNYYVNNRRQDRGKSRLHFYGICPFLWTAHRFSPIEPSCVRIAGMLWNFNCVTFS